MKVNFAPERQKANWSWGITNQLHNLKIVTGSLESCNRSRALAESPGVNSEIGHPLRYVYWIGVGPVARGREAAFSGTLKPSFGLARGWN